METLSWSFTPQIKRCEEQNGCRTRFRASGNPSRDNIALNYYKYIMSETKELTGAEHFKNFLFLLFGSVLLLAITVTTIKIIKHEPAPKPAPVVSITKDFHAGDAVLCENKFATVI